MKQLKNPKIKIKNKQKKITISKKAIGSLAKRVLKIKNASETELSILFVGKKRMRALNETFRNIDHPTDVLAFSMREGKVSKLHQQLLGDVVICPEIAKKYARHYKTPLRQEIDLDLIHGILHLLGYEDSTASGRAVMKREQRRLLKKLTRK